jgi:hypothetical protein
VVFPSRHRGNRLHDINSMLFVYCSRTGLFVYCRRTGAFLFITTSLRIAQRKKQCMQTSGPCTSKRSFDMRKVLESSHRRTRGRAGEGKWARGGVGEGEAIL